MVLRDEAHFHIVKTICKTWRCTVCKNKLRALYAARTRYGVHKLGPSYFITVTYEMGRRDALTAEVARSDLRRFWVGFRKLNPGAEWCRVTELTQKGQVHHHIIVGGIGNRMASCRMRPLDKGGYESWGGRYCVKQCLKHEVSKLWKGVTGDSYIVDASRVRSAGRMGTYLSKYILKGEEYWERLNELGFQRRWNCSRGWPSPGRMRLAGSKEHNAAWELRERSPLDRLARLERVTARERHHKDCTNMEPRGIDLFEEEKREAQRRKITGLIGGFTDANAIATR